MSMKSIETFLETYPPEVRELTLASRRLIAAALPGAQETLDESAKVIGYGYGPGYKGVVCTLILSRSGVKIGIARAVELPDPRHLLQGTGKVHRYVPIVERADLEQVGLRPLLAAALTAWRRRNEAG
jgi:hypothetical protein